MNVRQIERVNTFFKNLVIEETDNYVMVTGKRAYGLTIHDLEHFLLLGLEVVRSNAISEGLFSIDVIITVVFKKVNK